MPRANKKGNKALRAERNRAFQESLRRRKRLRKQRAAQFAHLPGQQPNRVAVPTSTVKAQKPVRHDLDEYRRTLEANTVGNLRQIAKREGVPVKSKMRKAEIIDALVEAAR